MEILYQSQKIELLRGICFFINDCRTFRCFALVSRYCATLAREYSPLKKKEFSIVRRFKTVGDDNMEKIREIVVLPNGQYHGFLEYYNTETRSRGITCVYWHGWMVACMWYDTIPVYSFGHLDMGPNTSLKWLFKNVEITKFNDYGYVIFIFKNLSNQKRVKCHACRLCKSHHVFTSTTNSRLILWKNCISTLPLRMRYLKAGEMEARARRLWVAMAVIRYSKMEVVKAKSFTF